MKTPSAKKFTDAMEKILATIKTLTTGKTVAPCTESIDEIYVKIKDAESEIWTLDGLHRAEAGVTVAHMELMQMASIIRGMSTSFESSMFILQCALERVGVDAHKARKRED